VRIVLGAGFTGGRVAALAAARGEDVLAVVRSAASAARLEGRGFRVSREPVLSLTYPEDAHVIVCFPPSGDDAALAARLAPARAVTYLSSTSVYGAHEGVVDDGTPVAPSPLVHVEDVYRGVGATVLRSPGIYGPDRGLHVRVRSGAHALPGDGAVFGSRIHVDDLAELLLASERVRGETFVVGDLEPARQCDVVRWICETYGCPSPPSVPPEQVPASLRRNRRIDGRRALAVLGVTLRYPSYREGMRP